MTRTSRIVDNGDGRFGRLIDRGKPLNFTFNGKRLQGVHGDTLASALLANDVAVVSRSFKFHRPRGIVSIGPEDPNGLVESGSGGRRTPNTPAATLLVHEGLAAASQNAWPSVKIDAASLLDRIRPALPPGFQHKTFKWPSKAWPFYEHAIRKLGGIGRAPAVHDLDRYEHVHAHADVLVVGGGIAGIAAAEAASAQGLSVVLAESSWRLGGIADAYDGNIDGQPILDWIRDKAAALAASGNVHILTSAEVTGLYDHGLALIAERLPAPQTGPEADNVPRERLWKLRARTVVLATGALEKPLVFPENDRPGVMLAASARLFMRRHAVTPGSRVVIATSGDEGYRTALDLEAAGVEIVRIVDLRLMPNGALFHVAKSRGHSIALGSAPVSTKSTWRNAPLSGVTIANRLTVDGPALQTDIACDTLLVSGGWAPAPFLVGHLGARLRFDPELGGYRTDVLPQGLFVAGAANAAFDVGAAIEDGWRAGTQACAHARGVEPGPHRTPVIDATQDDAADAIGALPDISTVPERLRAFVDFQNDVTVGDMEIAVREGYETPELLKRYTALGLGPDQGKLAVANAGAILPRLTKSDPASAAHTTFRPPWTPLTFGAVAGARRGELFRPVRATPLSPAFQDTEIEPFGLWNLPSAFPSRDETREAAVRREVRAVRNGIGIFDASSGAKIAVCGADAAAFLERMSATEIADTPIGKSRYALFLDESGFVKEDGVIARLADDRFLLSTGIGRAAPLTAWFERWRQTCLNELDVVIVEETERWAQILLAGPRVPELLMQIPGDIDISQFTVDSFAEGEIFGVPGRALASRYTAGSEIEISVPSGYGLSLWNFLLDAGQKLGITRFGTEALHRLRLEAGAFDLDRETDGTVTPYDLGLADLVTSRKGFVGREGLERPALTLPNRRHLVGILMEDRTLVPPPGAHLVIDPDHAPPRRTVGHVTSSGYSPTLRRSVALALISNGERHLGEEVFIVMSGEGRAAKISSTDFLGMAGDKA